MSKIKDLTDADIARLRIEVTDFQDGALWSAMQSTILGERERIIKDLADEARPAERLKFNQGELAQANRDIMLVERFLTALAKEVERRGRAMERS